MSSILFIVAFSDYLIAPQKYFFDASGVNIHYVLRCVSQISKGLSLSYGGLFDYFEQIQQRNVLSSQRIGHDAGGIIKTYHRY